MLAHSPVHAVPHVVNVGILEISVDAGGLENGVQVAEVFAEAPHLFDIVFVSSGKGQAKNEQPTTTTTTNNN